MNLRLPTLALFPVKDLLTAPCGQEQLTAETSAQANPDKPVGRIRTGKYCPDRIDIPAPILTIVCFGSAGLVEATETRRAYSGGRPVHERRS